MTETRNTRDEGPLLSPLVVALQADRVRSQRHPRLASPPPSAGFPHRRVQPSRLGASVWGDRARPPLSLSLSIQPRPSVGHLAAAFTGRGVPDLSPRSVCLPDSTRARGANQNQTETRRDDETGSGFPFGRFACIYNDLNLYIYSTLLLSLKLQNKDTSYKGRSIQVHSFFFRLSFAHGCSSIVLSLQTKTKKHIQQPTHACSSQRLSTLSTFRPYPCPPRGPP